MGAAKKNSRFKHLGYSRFFAAHIFAEQLPTMTWYETGLDFLVELFIDRFDFVGAGVDDVEAPRKPS